MKGRLPRSLFVLWRYKPARKHIPLRREAYRNRRSKPDPLQGTNWYLQDLGQLLAMTTFHRIAGHPPLKRFPGKPFPSLPPLSLPTSLPAPPRSTRGKPPLPEPAIHPRRDKPGWEQSSPGRRAAESPLYSNALPRLSAARRPPCP